MERSFQPGAPGGDSLLVNIFGQSTRLQKIAKEAESRPQKLQASTLLSDLQLNSHSLCFISLWLFSADDKMYLEKQQPTLVHYWST